MIGSCVSVTDCSPDGGGNKVYHYNFRGLDKGVRSD
jgi:hypothetical protein